ncbi:uncharacterized protein OCT59_008933 [Rhizophagus irregularis]|uniref:SAM domain-containing protein n=2 Tax=Rhizophagus irregularis TaxID=588596 RepID=A0A915ZQ33_9GLOM|nr:hypothetical protein OCT59_008933 [Rhizophagus irregularis]GET59214.1 hypothetical protein GLOIN_2v1797475 [Rhizophagus irregularis DAOM 181602=DAOM 197198]CAB4474920.1 unnamed protein product [Rhizophagus irregularis]CAB5386622.1 unnamed protein product [Rhizophagus irregularis]
MLILILWMAAISITTSTITSQLLPSYSLPFTLSHPSNISSMKEFLEELDKQYGESKYTNFLQKFEEEEITVSQIAEMSPEILLNEFGIEIMGRR